MSANKYACVEAYWRRRMSANLYLAGQIRVSHPAVPLAWLLIAPRHPPFLLREHDGKFLRNFVDARSHPPFIPVVLSRHVVQRTCRSFIFDDICQQLRHVSPRRDFARLHLLSSTPCILERLLVSRRPWPSFPQRTYRTWHVTFLRPAMH